MYIIRQKNKNKFILKQMTFTLLPSRGQTLQQVLKMVAIPLTLKTTSRYPHPETGGRSRR